MSEQLVQQNEDYLSKHRVFEVFEDLLTTVSYKRPENIREFLIKELETRKEKKTILIPIFNEKEVANIFKLYNVENRENITRIKAKQALKYMANSKYEFKIINEFEDIPERVDLELFKQLARNILGISF